MVKKMMMTSINNIHQNINNLKLKVNIQQALESQDNEISTWMKDEVIKNGNIRLLIEQILGYNIGYVHNRMIDFQNENSSGLILAFRGSGKTTISTISRIIFLILRNPNLRILLSSKTTDNAILFLKEIKYHFKENERFKSVFGNLIGDRWLDNDITIKGRTLPHKEGTVSIAGTEGTVTGRHFDYIFCDDICDENNCHTQLLRQRTSQWYNTTLMPTLMPKGNIYVIGTRYHPQDIYASLLNISFKEKQLIIPALDENDLSTFEEAFSTEFLKSRRVSIGTIAFNSQYQCQVSELEGKIFKYDWFKFINQDLAIKTNKIDKVIVGVDLAIGDKDINSDFAYVVMKVDDLNNYYVVEEYAGIKTFHEQILMITSLNQRYNPTVVGIEANAYQLALIQEIRRMTDWNVPIVKIYTAKNKIARAMQLSGIVESGHFFFANNIIKLVNEMLASPDGKQDLVDAVDIAIKAAKFKSIVLNRQIEPELIETSPFSVFRNRR